jgi:CTP synthase (UTP-ammonia lyase)
VTRIAVVGDRNPAYVTHRELDAELARLPAGVRAEWLPSERAREAIDGPWDGLWVAPGTPYHDDDAVLAAIDHARRDGLPLLGTCGGFQYAAIVLGRELACVDARHAELEPDAPEPFVAQLSCSLVGELRPVTAVPGTRVAALLGTAPFEGFHFCGYGLTPSATAALERAGVRVAAHAPDAGVEALELPDHPFFVATLFQPQIGAAAGAPRSPLVEAFVAAARQRSAAVSV